MTKHFLLSLQGMLLGWSILLTPSVQAQSTVEVRYTEGLIRGFLLLRTIDGNIIAYGNLAQVARGERVTSHLELRFKHGSIYDETVHFSQQGSFQLANYRLVQEGPIFKVPIDMTVDRSTGQVLVRYTGEDGKEKVESERLKFLAGGAIRKATEYRIKVEIGGILGFLAPLVGKQPEDTHAWVLDGDAPVFVRLEGPLFMGGPSWRIEPASPVWQAD